MKKLLIPFLVIFLTACSSNRQASTFDYSTEFDFAAVESFSTSQQKTDFIYSVDDTRQQITDALINKGLKPVEKGKAKADIIVHFMVTYLGEKASMTLGLGAGTGAGNVGIGIGGGIPIGKKNVARIELRVFEQEKQQLVWKYFKDARYKTEEEKKAAISEAIAEMLTQYPPEKSE